MQSEIVPAEQNSIPTKVAVGVGGKVAAFVPASLEETWRLSTIIAQSQMAPKSYNNDANKIMVGIMAGLELGLTPFTALQSIAVIGNNPSVWGDGALALVEASGLLEYHHEVFDDRTSTATCTVKRVGKPSETVRTFSFEDAKKASLLGKQGPWQGYPKRMCQMRARAFALRDTFADVLKGIGIAEEVRDYTPIGEARPYGGEFRSAPLSAALLNAQASGENEPIETIDGSTGEVLDEPSAEPAVPQWMEQEQRIRDLVFLAADRVSLEDAEKAFLAVAPTFPEKQRSKMQAEIDAAFKALIEAD